MTQQKGKDAHPMIYIYICVYVTPCSQSPRPKRMFTVFTVLWVLPTPLTGTRHLSMCKVPASSHLTVMWGVLVDTCMGIYAQQPFLRLPCNSKFQEAVEKRAQPLAQVISRALAKHPS